MLGDVLVPGNKELRNAGGQAIGITKRDEALGPLLLRIFTGWSWKRNRRRSPINLLSLAPAFRRHRRSDEAYPRRAAVGMWRHNQRWIRNPSLDGDAFVPGKVTGAGRLAVERHQNL